MSKTSASEWPGGAAREWERCWMWGKFALKSSSSFPSGFWLFSLERGVGSQQVVAKTVFERDARKSHASLGMAAGVTYRFRNMASGFHSGD